MPGKAEEHVSLASRIASKHRLPNLSDNAMSFGTVARSVGAAMQQATA